VRVEGKGTVWSWAVFHHNYLDEFSPHLPYTVMVVTLEEGVRMCVAPHPDEHRSPLIGDRIQLEIGPYAIRRVPLARFISEVAS
jgi:uncharacterized OB-fold protein